MLRINKTELIGNITHNLEVKKTDGGRAVCNFQLAVDDSYRDKEGKTVERTQWINCTIFGPRAEHLATYAKKGTRLFVEGKLTGGSYETEDGKRHTQGVQVFDWQFAVPKRAPTAAEANDPEVAKAEATKPRPEDEPPF